VQWTALGYTGGDALRWSPDEGLFFLGSLPGYDDHGQLLDGVRSIIGNSYGIDQYGAVVGSFLLDDGSGGLTGQWLPYFAYDSLHPDYAPHTTSTLLRGYVETLYAGEGHAIPWAICNDRIVGTFQVPDPARSDIYHAFINHHNEILDLNDRVDWRGAPWVLVEALDVNADGYIVGWGYRSDGLAHAFLLGPSWIPEPGTASVMGLAAIALLGRRRRPMIQPPTNRPRPPPSAVRGPLTPCWRRS